MSLKYIKTRDKVFESWLNPILSGSTITGQCNSIIPPVGTPTIFQSQDDMIEKPIWLDNDDETVVRNGDILSIGSYFINGVPLSSWSANFGSSVAYKNKQTMHNWYHIDAITNHVFPNGIKAYLNKNEDIEYNISELTIMRMVPNSNAIGLNAYIKFKLNDKEIWGKFDNIGIDAKPKFICGDMELTELNIETKIKVVGKLWNTMIDWFKSKPGIYRCIAKEVLVYSELGQLKRISEGDVIEVMNADDNKIKFKYNETVYFVKKPTYYWFNWYFENK